jgi:hypothetical protein
VQATFAAPGDNIARSAAAGLAAGALGGTMGAVLYMAQVGDLRDPLLWVYVVLFGTCPGLIVGGGLGTVAGLPARRGHGTPRTSASAAVGALAAIVTAAMIFLALTAPYVPLGSVLGLSVTLAALPGAVAGIVWRSIALGSPALRRRSAVIVATVLVASAAQLTMYAVAQHWIEARPSPAYPSPDASD